MSLSLSSSRALVHCFSHESAARKSFSKYALYFEHESQIEQREANKNKIYVGEERGGTIW